jgi:hypothetical protein
MEKIKNNLNYKILQDGSYVFNLSRRNGEIFVVGEFGDTHNPLNPESFTITYRDDENKFNLAVMYSIEILGELIKKLQKTLREYKKYQ